MFLQPPFNVSTHMQDVSLIINTVLLIACILVAELAFAEVPAEKRQHVRYVYPLLAVLVGLLLFAVYHQGARVHG